jgi:hypothetical protein
MLRVLVRRFSANKNESKQLLAVARRYTSFFAQALKVSAVFQ